MAQSSIETSPAANILTPNQRMIAHDDVDVTKRDPQLVGDRLRERRADVLALLRELRVGFGQQTARALVSFLLRQRLVERGIIEVIRPGGSEEGDGAVVGDFIQRAIVAHMHALEIHGRGEQSGQRHCRRQMQKPGLRAEGPLPHLPKEAARREQPAQAQDQTNGEDEADVIGLPDVDEDLLGINEVIDGDGVEARFEFIKEEMERQAIFETARINYDSEESTESIITFIKTNGLVS